VSTGSFVTNITEIIIYSEYTVIIHSEYTVSKTYFCWSLTWTITLDNIY